MKKYDLRKWLASSVAIVAAIAFQSCQSKQPETKPDCPATQPKDSDKMKKDSKQGCKQEEASTEVMTHTIEIDQPDASNVSEKKGTVVPKAEAPAETPLGTSAIPASIPVAVSTEPTLSVETVAVEAAPVTISQQ